MKYLPHLLVCLSLGLSVGCAPAASGQNPTVTVGEDVSVKLTPTPVSISTVTPTPTIPSSETPAPAPTLTLTLLPSPSFTPGSTSTLAPTPTPTSIPGVTPTLTHTPTPAPASANSATTLDPVERGFEVYKQQYCGLCHQLDAASTAGQFGPTHNGMGAIAQQRLQETQYTGAATTAAEYIHESIVNPKIYVVAGYEHTQHHMPAYVHLSETDVDGLVQMLLQQK